MTEHDDTTTDETTDCPCPDCGRTPGPLDRLIIDVAMSGLAEAERLVDTDEPTTVAVANVLLQVAGLLRLVRDEWLTDEQRAEVRRIGRKCKVRGLIENHGYTEAEAETTVDAMEIAVERERAMFARFTN